MNRRIQKKKGVVTGNLLLRRKTSRSQEEYIRQYHGYI
jgi:hypothetical protein